MVNIETEIVEVFYVGKKKRSIWIWCPNSTTGRKRISACTDCPHRKGLVFGKGVLCDFEECVKRSKEYINQ